MTTEKTVVATTVNGCQEDFLVGHHDDRLDGRPDDRLDGRRVNCPEDNLDVS